MAGLCGLKTVLLWVVIVGLASCQSTGTTATPPPPPSCNYTVAKISSGFQITVKNIPTDYNIISIAETGQPENEVKDSNVSFSKQSSTHQFINLKPCTDYQLNVTFIDINSSKTICSSTENKKTSKPREQDITYSNCDPGYICYRSDWNISSSQLKHNNDSAKWKNGGFNFELKNDDFCSNFTVNFTPENCKNSSFTFTKYIPFEFINPNEINQCKPTGLPAEIETELPPNCQNLSVEYTCSGPGSVNLSLSDLEPFTNYSCTGLIKNSDGSTLKTLPPVEFNIDCELKIENKQTVTNTSIELKWETTSKNCGAVLLKLKELSYTCSCEDNKRNLKHPKESNNPSPDEGSCKFDKLEPFTDYTCEVQPTYKNFKVSGKKTIQLKTKPGVPDKIEYLGLVAPESNEIMVYCEPSEVNFNFKGPEKIFRASLNSHNKTERVNNTSCDFYFNDLDYLTAYEVKVVADNGVLQSEPTIRKFKTSYHISYYVRLIVVPFSAVLPGVAICILNRKLKQI